MPVRSLSALEFLERARTLTVLDVRTPSEFTHGHIPGASSLPLFSDEERAEIGTLYVQKGRANAIKRGLDFVGPRMRALLEAGEAAARDGAVLVHCWRGGMRSGSLAWLFGFYGLDVGTLEGGYKNFRRYIIDDVFTRNRDLRVLAGRTGAGKTATLLALARAGQRVVDLEGLARHRGSAFGALGQAAAPTQEQFDNNLGMELDRLDFPAARAEPASLAPVWVEDENRTIGRLALPGPLYAAMRSAPLVYIDAPFDRRVAYLMEEYGRFPAADLALAVQNIARRLGGLETGRALDAILAGDLRTACEIALRYYDSAYEYALAKRDGPRMIKIDGDPFTPDENARRILTRIMHETKI